MPGQAEWDVLLDLGGAPGEPLHRRLRHALRHQITSGALPMGTALPPSRRLAAELGCSRWVVTEAFAQLAAEGYLTAVPGSATRVAWTSPAQRVSSATAASAVVPVRHDLAPGLPDLRAFPRRRWADAVTATVTGIAHGDLAHGDPRGHHQLRTVVAAHVVRTRGAVADVGDVRIGVSVTDCVARLCGSLAALGVKAVACEDPGWPRLRHAIESAGLRVVPVRVDGEGIVVDDLHRHRDVRAVLVTAAHQFPTGVVLSARRRAQLVQWAGTVDGYVLEDDYDAEFRYDREPVGSLQAMDPERVALLKSASKTLSPALGLAWMVVPARLRADPAQRPPHLPPTIDQLALARVVDSGSYDRHLRSCRVRYRARRDRLVEALRVRLPDAVLSGIPAGLHLVVTPPASVPGRAWQEAARRHDVGVMALDRYLSVERGSPAIVVGYGNLADSSVVPAVDVLAHTWRDLSR